MWYRYEVDLGDEAAGVSVVAQGTELGELAAEDRLANAAPRRPLRLAVASALASLAYPASNIVAR